MKDKKKKPDYDFSQPIIDWHPLVIEPVKRTGYRITGRFTVACQQCGGNTTLRYARQHGGKCKPCAEPGATRNSNRNASKEEQHARYIDCGPANWDDR